MPLFSELENTLHSITGGFLAPVFFGFLGLHFSLSTLRQPGFVICVLVVSVGSKILAGWLGGRLAKLDATRSLGIGIILNGRGIMELVVANIALQRGFINEGLFSTLVLMVCSPRFSRRSCSANSCWPSSSSWKERTPRHKKSPGRETLPRP